MKTLSIIVQVDGDRIRMGMPPGATPDQRPTQLSPYYFIREP